MRKINDDFNGVVFTYRSSATALGNISLRQRVEWAGSAEGLSGLPPEDEDYSVM